MYALAALFAAFFATEAPAQAARYKGVAVGAAIKNQYPFGDWADYAATNIGLSVFAEYTIPAFLPKNLDLGASARFDYDHTFSKKESTLSQYEGFTANAGLWLRIPFCIKGHTLALQPEFSYGAHLAFAKGKNGVSLDDSYLSQAICVAPALRYVVPAETLKNLEFEFSPLWTIMPQKGGGLIQTIGFRLGAVWHLKSNKKGGAEWENWQRF